jgi:hypothetical protein
MVGSCGILAIYNHYKELKNRGSVLLPWRVSADVSNDETVSGYVSFP